MPKDNAPKKPEHHKVKKLVRLAALAAAAYGAKKIYDAKKKRPSAAK